MRIEKECIEGCLSGEATSQRKLYNILLPYLNALCRRYLNDTSHVKDILQESFILIFKNISQFDSEKGAFHSWASRIVINLSLKHNKSSKSRFYSELDKQEKLPEVTPDVLNQMTDQELVRFLKTMPPNYYEVFNLYTVDGFTHEEIAQILSIKVSLSRKRLARARAWLQAKPKSLNSLLGDYRFSIS
ncbi:MAG: RNA polymerase sigma factor [Flavobacteriales bacterium]